MLNLTKGGGERSNSQKSKRGEGLAFTEWVRKKDAEKRLKRKLVREIKNDMRA
jgi:hypothetical protein